MNFLRSLTICCSKINPRDNTLRMCDTVEIYNTKKYETRIYFQANNDTSLYC